MDSIIQLIELIKNRPAMYLGRNSISCLKAFIDGWYLRDTESVTDTNNMEDFQEWIKVKYKISTTHSWCDIILFNSQDENDALINFFKNFEEWKAGKVK